MIVDRGPGHVRCGNHPEEWRVYHKSVAAVRACYAILEDMAREQQAGIYAEDAWLRAAENRWDPDEDRERMAEALGYGPPPGY